MTSILEDYEKKILKVGYFSGVFSITFIIQKTTKAIIRKSMMAATKWLISSTTGLMVRVASCHAPPGMKNGITGMSMSETRAETSLPASSALTIFFC